MIYDEELSAVRIGVSELVSIARRGISPSVPKDEDEPRDSSPSKIELRSLGIPLTERSLLLALGEGEGALVISGRVTLNSDGGIVIVKETDRMRGKPSRELCEKTRGEGFIYAYLLSREDKLDKISLTLVYINAVTGERTEAKEEIAFSSAERFFNKCMATVSIYARPERERVSLRLPTMRSLKFPYKTVREGQSDFVRRAYKTLCRGGSLFALAPTGTGKTVAALFPAIRAMGEGKCTKVFYLTPKTTTAKAAKECIELMTRQGASIKATILTAKERVCKNGLRCRDGFDLCENSAHNRLCDAVLELYSMNIPVVTADNVAPVSRKYAVCPYELALTYAELCDVIICDFNYLFDPRVYIRRFFDEGGDYAFLIDEAHNLPDRAREMFSAEISAEELASPSGSELLGELSQVKLVSVEASHALFTALYPLVKDEIRLTGEGEVGAVHLSELPSALFGIFERLLSVCEEEITDTLRARDEEKKPRLRLLRDYYYRVKRVYDAMVAFDSDYQLFIFYEHAELRFKLYCIDTGRRISDAISKGRSAVFFSATLSPLDYYRAVLGGDRGSEIMEADSPFAPEQLAVCVMDRISTRYSEREDTLLSVCRAIAATLSAKRGNYIVFSPSFAYSEALSGIFKSKYPHIKTLVQEKNMSQTEKTSFLSAFSEKNGSYLVAFCVMGGIFAEGVDLVGDSLIGAVVVGIGMPQLSYEREAIAAYFDDRYEKGREFAYVYPGMNRVLQAAGRVIRREEDRGVIVLIDDRFDDPIYKKSLPKLWRGIKFISDPKELKVALEDFWREAY